MVRNLAGVVAVSCLVMSITNGALGLGPVAVLINLVIPVVVLVSVVYIQETGQLQGAYSTVVSLVCLVLFPIGFFATGGSYGVMPYYFLTGVALTSFMLHGWRFVLAAVAEVALFSGSMWVALARPEYLEPDLDHIGLQISQPVGFTCAAVVIALSVQLVYHHYVRATAQLNRSNQALIEAAHNKDAFLALLAHELKTPIAVMASHAQEVSRTLASVGHQSPELERVRGDMSTIMRQSASLSGMVTQLLDINRIDEGRLVFNMGRVPLAQVVQETLAECAHIFANRDNELRLAGGGAHPTVTGDRARINRVLLNLLSNASRHTQGGVITVHITKEEGFARVTIEDTGEGMTSEQIEHVLAVPTVGSAVAAPEAGPDTGSEAGPAAAGNAAARARRWLGRRLRRLRPARGAVSLTPDAVPPSSSPDLRPAWDVGGELRPESNGSPIAAVAASAAAREGADGAPPGTVAHHAPRGVLPMPSGSRHGGLGLGLRIVRYTVDMHGGTFSLTSELGKGTVASFTVPLAPPLPPPGF
ncbi:MAG: sensor histidine kinase, partial [Bifidobacteriaceae bacterium]|jgi:signal transduction histidine kinase|nr:sensor histidine kinase [Bifidobacteriaceae bacterium]